MASKYLDMRTTEGYDMRSSACRAIAELHNPYSSGWEAEPYKQDLYYMILWLQEEYGKLPQFVGEAEWKKEIEQKFIIDKLSRKS
jgi:hypothetical protein